MKLRECKRCGLSLTRKNIVLGKGTGSSGIMIVGEDPGKNEDLRGVPFVGLAGSVLDKVIKSFWLSSPSQTMDQLYITNVVKCFPTIRNKVSGKLVGRAPTKEEIRICGKWLDLEIRKMHPTIIIALGNTALQKLTGEGGISTKRGFGIWSKEYDCIIYAMYHPSYIQRNHNEWGAMSDDVRKLKGLLYAPWWEVSKWIRKLKNKQGV